jgi:hypothetical protein
MKTDILKKIKHDFGSKESDVSEALEALDTDLQDLFNDRIVRAIIFLAKGDMSRFAQLCALARTDPRDVLWQAEYDCGEDQLYDFNKTFHKLQLL